MIKISRKKAALAALAATALASPVLAVHSWNNYHWTKGSAELSIPTGDNVDSRWDSYLDVAIVDWNKSTVINSSEVPGSTNPKNCRAVAGTIQVCNSSYGFNGWLGLASISISGGHITQGTTKVNDSYYNTATYNTPAWRAAVMCQEIGHDYGLGHQDEDSSTDNTTSCMDYTNRPEGNEHPDSHDYAQLVSIYNHAESASMTLGGRGNSAAADVGDTPAEWGRAIHFMKDGRPDLFERIDGPGAKTITHVYWAVGEGPRNFRH